MGKRGGLNILPQKKWNVYNWDNRIKVQRDEKLVEKAVNSLINQKRKTSFNKTIDAIRKGEQLISNDNCSIVLTDKDKTKIYMDEGLLLILENTVDYLNRIAIPADEMTMKTYEYYVRERMKKRSTLCQIKEY